MTFRATTKIFVTLATLGLGVPQLAAAPVDVGAEFVVGCPTGFDLSISVDGKGNTLDVPGPRIFFTSPGLVATLVNTATGNAASVSVTGSLVVTPTESGLLDIELRGRNLVLFPNGEGVLLVVGVFGYTLDGNGNEVTRLSGQGRTVDLCALVE